MTYNYPTPGLISQYIPVSIDHILLKLRKGLLIHHLIVSHLIFTYLFIYYYYFVTLYLCIHSLMPSVVHYISS
jgi:hypothetical protein